MKVCMIQIQPKLPISSWIQMFKSSLFRSQLQKFNYCYSMPSHIESLSSYRQIIQDLQKTFLQNVTDQSLFRQFKIKLSSKFKLDITFDSDFSQALREYFKTVSENFMGTENFISKLRYIQKLNNALYNKKFISRRDFIRQNQILKREIQSPINSWLQQLAYLKNAESLEQFRADFLLRYMHVPDQEIDNLITNDQEMIKYYHTFFRSCLDSNIKPRLINYIEDIFSQQQNKSSMLSPAIIQELQKKLGAEVGGSQKQIRLNTALVNLAQENAYQNDQNLQQRLDNQYKQIQRALQKFSGLNLIKQKKINLHLGKFGSLASGFASADADLDLTILTNNYVNQIELLKLLNQFLKRQYKQEGRRTGRRVALQLITTAKTPLVSVKVNQIGQQEIKIDIIVNNILGVINSQFLKVYSSVRWVKNLGLLVKMWGKAQGLIRQSMLSSYAMVLMLIHYLIQKNLVNPLMDARDRTKQMPNFHFKRTKLGDIEQFDVYYSFKTSSKDVTNFQRANYCKILTGFMKYYAFDLWKLEPNKRIITVDMSQDRPIDAETTITIKDPFDKPHNPGRLSLVSNDFFLQKFKDGYEVLCSGKEDRILQLFKNQK